MLSQQDVQAAVRRAGRLIFANRPALEQYQRDKLQFFFRHQVPKSLFYKPWLGKMGTLWPMMDARGVHEHFGALCTARLSYKQVFAQGIRIYARGGRWPAMDDYYVMMKRLSRHDGWELTVLDESEQLKKLGHLLASLRSGSGLGARVSIAHFFESASILHRIKNLDDLNLQVYDLFKTYEYHKERLLAQQPEIIIAPQGILLRLAYDKLKNGMDIAPSKVYCENGRLTTRDRMMLRKAFGMVHEMYTKGGNLLAVSCDKGHMHLCESHYFFEMQWLDDDRFMPIYTDFNSVTVPIVRYQTNDVMIADAHACPCGQPQQTIKRRESREEDVFWLAGRAGGFTPVFSRVFEDHAAACVPWDGEYRVVQTGINSITCYAPASTEGFKKREKYLLAKLESLGVNSQALQFSYALLPANHQNPNGTIHRVTRANFTLPTNCYFQ